MRPGLHAWRHRMKNVRTSIRITSYGLTKRLPEVQNRITLCTFLRLQNNLKNWFNVSRLFIFLTNILFIITGNTLEGDVSDVIALDQLTSPFSPRKATKMSP